MLGTKAATYAILSVLEIARRGGPTRGVRAKEIAELFHLPAAYAAKVMTQLGRASILTSGRGPRGGFMLAKSPDAINFLEIIEAVDGLVGTETASIAAENMRDVMDRLNRMFDQAAQQMRDQLRKISVAEFLRKTPTETWIAQPEPAAAAKTA